LENEIAKLQFSLGILTNDASLEKNSVSYETFGPPTQPNDALVEDSIIFPNSDSLGFVLLLVPLGAFVVFRSGEKESVPRNSKKFFSLGLAAIMLLWSSSSGGIQGIGLWDNAIAEEYDYNFESINFDKSDSSHLIFEGQARINQQANPYLELNGENDYVKLHGTGITENQDSFTVSAWVKPDYSADSPEFTILSKPQSFSLSINNLVSPEKSAKFSVFDGTKWYNIESHTSIQEEWTHVAASFFDSSLDFFVP